MRNDGPVVLLLLIGMLLIIIFSIKSHLLQEEQIHDLCMEYYKQVNKTKDNNPKIAELCSIRKFSMKEYSETLDGSKGYEEIPEIE